MRHKRRALAILSIAVAVWLDVVSGGCLPLLARDPRVTPGRSASVALAVPVAHGSDSSSNYPILNLVAARLSYGWSPEPEHRPSIEAGVTAPFALVFLPEPDIYVQAPRSITGGLDAGVGVSLPWVAATVIPYTTIGHVNQRGAGWFASAGYTPSANVNGTSTTGRERAWLYGLGLQLSDKRGLNQVFVQGMNASGVRLCQSPTVCSTEHPWLAAVGLNFRLTSPATP